MIKINRSFVSELETTGNGGVCGKLENAQPIMRQKQKHSCKRPMLYENAGPVLSVPQYVRDRKIH
jgi:hypothetical protein